MTKENISMRVKKHTVTALLLSASLLCAGCSGFPGPSAQTGTGSTGQPDTQTAPFPEADGDSQGTGPETGTEETENADSLTEDSEDYTTSDYDAHYNSLFGEDYIRPLIMTPIITACSERIIYVPGWTRIFRAYWNSPGPRM